MTNFDEERVAALLRLLPPAPPGWVEAAQELPRARAEIASIVERAQRDAAYRAVVLADLEAAVREAGVEPSQPVLAHLRKHLQA